MQTSTCLMIQCQHIVLFDDAILYALDMQTTTCLMMHDWWCNANIQYCLMMKLPCLVTVLVGRIQPVLSNIQIRRCFRLWMIHGKTQIHLIHFFPNISDCESVFCCSNSNNFRNSTFNACFFVPDTHPTCLHMCLLPTPPVHMYACSPSWLSTFKPQPSSQLFCARAPPYLTTCVLQDLAYTATNLCVFRIQSVHAQIL